MSDYFTIWVAEANIGKASSADQAENNIKKMTNAFGDSPAPIHNWCEIDEGGHGDETSMIHKHLPGYKWAAGNSMIPIGISPDWTVKSTRSTPTHPGLSGVTPARPITDCHLVHSKHTWCEIALINSHSVAGAFTNPGQSHEEQRRDYWYWWWGAMKMRVADYLHSGVLTFVSGDFNNPNCPAIHDNQHTLVHASLDYILMIVPDSPKFHAEKTSTKTIDLTIDGHNGHAAAVKFTKK